MFLSKVFSNVRKVTLRQSNLNRLTSLLPNRTSYLNAKFWERTFLSGLIGRTYHKTAISSEKKKDNRIQTPDTSTTMAIAKARNSFMIGAISYSQLQKKLKELTKPSNSETARKSKPRRKTSTAVKEENDYKNLNTSKKKKKTQKQKKPKLVK